jgi:hypothetical protein
MWILSGKDPEKFKSQRMSTPRIGNAISPTQGLKRGRRPSNRIPMGQEPSKSQLVAMALDVLESMTIHASALASNIQIFYNALKDEEEMADMCDKILTLQNNVNHLNEIVQTKDKLTLDPT